MRVNTTNKVIYLNHVGFESSQTEFYKWAVKWCHPLWVESTSIHATGITHFDVVVVSESKSFWVLYRKKHRKPKHSKYHFPVDAFEFHIQSCNALKKINSMHFLSQVLYWIWIRSQINPFWWIASVRLMYLIWPRLITPWAMYSLHNNRSSLVCDRVNTHLTGLTYAPFRWWGTHLGVCCSH